MNPVIYIDDESILVLEFLFKKDVNDLDIGIGNNMLMAICVGIDSVLSTLEGDFNSKLDKINEVFTNSSLTGLLSAMRVEKVKFTIESREKYESMFEEKKNNIIDKDSDENVDGEVIQTDSEVIQ